MGNYFTSSLKSSKKKRKSSNRNDPDKSTGQEEEEEEVDRQIVKNSKKDPLRYSSNSTNSKTKKPTNIRAYKIMSSVILHPTIKQTASVIFLHGLGDTGNGWSSIFASIKKPHIKYIFPTAPIRPVTLNGGFEMNSWFDILGLSPGSPQDEQGIKSASQSLLDLVQEEIKSGIPSERIFIGGFSQGGATALYTAMISPFSLAGVIAMSTWLPLHNQFPSKLIQSENKFNTPIIQCHGDSDSIVPLEWGQMTGVHIQSLGFKNYAFKKYRGLGHAYSGDEIDEVDEFVKKIASQ